MYLFDPQRGEERRRRLESLWRDGRSAALQTERRASQSAESIRPLVLRVQSGLKSGNWVKKPSRKPALTSVVAAIALGGGLVYFLDPNSGQARRRRVLSYLGDRRIALMDAWHGVKATAGASERQAKRAADRTSDAVADLRAKSHVSSL